MQVACVTAASRTAQSAMGTPQPLAHGAAGIGGGQGHGSVVKVMRISFHFYAVDSGMMTAEMLNNVPAAPPNYPTHAWPRSALISSSSGRRDGAGA